MDETTVQLKELFDALYLSEKDLTGGQIDFIAGCKRQFNRTKELSEQQIKILFEIRKYLVADEPVRMTRMINILK